MPIGLRKHKSYLDGRRCLEVWCETGSVYKARIKLANEGMVHPDSGKPPSQQGVWNASWLFILSNPLDARKMIEEVWKQNGELMTDKDWYVLFTKNARYLLSDKAFKKLLEQHAYLKPYEELARNSVKSKRGSSERQELHPVVVSE